MRSQLVYLHIAQEADRTIFFLLLELAVLQNPIFFFGFWYADSDSDYAMLRSVNKYMCAMQSRVKHQLFVYLLQIGRQHEHEEEEQEEE